MKLKDAKEVRVTITYIIDYDKCDFEELNSDDIIRQAEKDCTEGSGTHEYSIEGTDSEEIDCWESIEDE